jgi:hypothetical protein
MSNKVQIDSDFRKNNEKFSFINEKGIEFITGHLYGSPYKNEYELILIGNYDNREECEEDRELGFGFFYVIITKTDKNEFVFSLPINQNKYNIHIADIYGIYTASLKDNVTDKDKILFEKYKDSIMDEIYNFMNKKEDQIHE